MRHSFSGVLGIAMLTASAAFAAGPGDTGGGAPDSGGGAMGRTAAPAANPGMSSSTHSPAAAHRKIVSHHRVKHPTLTPLSCPGMGKTCPPGSRPPHG